MRKVYLLFLLAMLPLLAANAQVDNQASALTRGSSSKGDLNGDGKVNVADVVTLVNLILKDEDKNEESETGIRVDVGTFNTQIKNLEQRIAILEAQDMGVEQLKKDLEALKAEVAEMSNKTTVEDKEFKNLQNQIDSLAKAIEMASATMVTGVVLQETLDCVVGTINLPGFNPAFLAAYVGENKTGIPEFPISGSDYNFYPNGYYLKASELPTDENMFVGNSGKNAYLVNGTGNAGKLYFTINPRKVDPTLLQFSLINSTGEESPIGLSEVKKSDHLITYAIGRHGNGLTRTDGDFPYTPSGTNVENDKTYLYEAKATVALDGIEKIHFDWTKFGYQNKWDAGASLLGTDQGADTEANNMYGRYLYFMRMIKTKQFENVLEASLKLIQDFYNGLYSQRSKLQKSALRVSWDDGENDVISGFDITTVTINPLNFKQMALSEEIMPWSFVNFEKTLGDLAKTIRENASDVTSVALKSVSMDGSQPKMTITAGTSDVVINISEELYNAINNGMELSSLEQIVNAILHPYQTLRNSGSGTMTRVDSYLNKSAANAMREKGGNIALNGVEPILLFENAEGIRQLHSNMTINGDGATTFIMTSFTEEYIVPAYMKYIAVIQEGRVVEANTFEGKEKLAQLSLPVGESEIVYQVSDFYGNVITKRYAVNRNQ